MDALLGLANSDTFILQGWPDSREGSASYLTRTTAALLIEQAATRLRAGHPGRPGGLRGGHDFEVAVDTHESTHRRATWASGGVYQDGLIVAVSLPAAWAQTVHEQGLADIDGYFVLDVDTLDEHGRPTRAFALDLRP
jgi:hypothetical protein